MADKSKKNKECKKERFVKICPQCGSTNTKIPPAGLDIKMSFPDYCIDCGNRGIFPEVKESKINGFKGKIKKEKEKREG